MKKLLKLSSVILTVAMLASALVASAHASYGEQIDGYDDYGYYASYDFEEWTSSHNSHAD
jgi:hypothetical protein